MTAAEAVQGDAGSAMLAPVARETAGDWIAVFAGILGAFMAVLDISVTNSSLAQIQGEIGATGSEGSWIGTGYLVSEIIMIPLSAWFVRVLGLRNFLLFAVIGFVAFSVGCGVSSSLIEMIVCRVGQGFTGGAMIPTAMTIVTLRLSPPKQPIGYALFGLTVIMAPVFGPLLGGWLTDNINWHYIFYLNLPVGVALVVLIMAGVAKEKAHFSEFARADFVGIAGLVLGLGGLTITLEEGQKVQWFEDKMIVATTAACLLGACLVAYSQWKNPKPVIKLRLLLNRSAGGSFFVSLIVGAALYSIPFILPVYLSTVAGYNAEQTGQVVFISGIPSLILLPVVPFLVRVIDLRLVAATGLIFFAASCFTNLALTQDTGVAQLVVPQLLRGVGQALIMTPLNQAATAGVAREDAGDAAGLYNMGRNLGGSLGLALTATLIDYRTVFHAQQLSQSVSSNSAAAQDYMHGSSFDQFSQTIHMQALIMTYSDCFFLFGVSLIAVMPILLILRPLSGSSTTAAH